MIYKFDVNVTWYTECSCRMDCMLPCGVGGNSTRRPVLEFSGRARSRGFARQPKRFRSSESDGDNDSHLSKRLEEIMASAKDLRQQYFDLMAEASAIRGDDNEDAARSIREDLFQMSLQELQTSLGVDDPSSAADEEQEMRDVEDYAAMIERGENIPPPPSGMYFETKESGDSFVKRLKAGYQMFKDVVQGRMKVGQLMDEHSDLDAASDLLTDVPEEKSRFVPDIPQEAMDMYTFGERVLYVLRRGYQSETFAKPVELLDSYGLLADDIELETSWASIRGKGAVKQYCSKIDRASSFMKCSNLLMSYPTFELSDSDVIAEGISDIAVFVRVPKWYSSYCLSTGKGFNTVSVKNQIDIGIDVPETLFPWKNRENFREPSLTTLPTTNRHYDPRKLKKGTSSTHEKSIWKTKGYKEILNVEGILDDVDWLSWRKPIACNDPNSQTKGNSITNNQDTSLPTSIDDFTPDDAEKILRSLFGDKFDDIAQQLPKKASIPPNIDPEYRPIFEEDAPDQIKCAITWVFEADLISKKVLKIRVVFNWVNLGHVHEEDLFYVLTTETEEFLYEVKDNTFDSLTKFQR